MRRKRKTTGRDALLALFAVALLLAGGVAQRLGGAAVEASTPSPLFSRVMTANRSACHPVGGRYYDWIELANPSGAEIALRGWRLADSLDLRGAYVFGDVSIPAGGALLVYCDGRPEDAPEDALFTGFRLDSDGELLVLADPMERLAETLVVPALKDDHVYRRDDAGEWIEEPVEPEADVSAAMDTGELRINEVMPVNRTALADADGDYSDWIELYNASEAPVDLEGCALSDEEGRMRWRFPALSLGAGEYLVVFASGKNRFDPAGELHTNFRLSASDGIVRLYDANDRLLSSLACDTQEADVSVCRDDIGGVTKLWVPTPGYRNSQAGLPDALPLLTENAYGLYINEVMNVAGGADWVELYNAGPADLDLGSMGLSDNPARPRKWQFPTGATIAQGGCLLVALSGGDDATRGAYTADFGVATGETLCLSLTDGTIIDRIMLYARPKGASYGRATGEARYRYFAEPTPGAPNATRSYAGQTAPVTFSERGGLRDETSITVALSSGPGAAIHYTLDGTEPTEASSVYAGPLTLTASTVVRAMAVGDGLLPSAGSAATYILNEGHDAGLYTVCVSGDYEALIGESGALNTGFKKDECDVYVEIYDGDGAPLIGQACNLQISGHSSRLENSQKAFRLKARSEYGDSRFRAKLFSNRDYTTFKAITLRASGQDNRQTLMRDSVLTALAADTGVMYLETEVATVFIDGRYWGLYNLRERVTADGVARFEGWSDPDDVIIVCDGKREYGSRASYISLMDWVAQADLSSEENLQTLRQYVDVENYLDYVALEMYTCNLDLSNVRCYCNPTVGGRWKWLFYDLDLSYQVDRNMARDWLTPGGVGTITQQDNTLFVKLMENPEMREVFLSRMGELLRTTFSAENVIARFQARHDLMADEMVLHFARWGGSIDKWHRELKAVIDYARERPAKLAEYLTSAFQLSDAEAQAYFSGIA